MEIAGSQVSDRCPLGYFFYYRLMFSANSADTEQKRMGCRDGASYTRNASVLNELYPFNHYENYHFYSLPREGRG